MSNDRPRLKLITAPTVEPISLSEMKSFLRIDDSETLDDAFITALIETARTLAEEYTMRAFITQTWDVYFDDFWNDFGRRDLWFSGVRELPISALDGESNFIRIPRPPLQSVTVYSIDEDNAETTFSSTLYFVDTQSDPGRVILNDSQLWPDALRNLHSVRVRFIAGYGATAATVPAPIRNALKIMVGYLFEQRGCGDMSMPDAVKKLLMPYRILRM